MPSVNPEMHCSPQGPRATARALLLWAMALALAAGIATAVGLPGASSAGPELAARVNGEPVTRDELQRLLADPLARRQLQQELGGHQPDPKKLELLALRTLINRRLILQEAARRNITVTREDLSQATVALRQRFKELKDLGAWMKARGLDDEGLQMTLRNDLLMTRAQAALVEGVRVSDEEVQTYYDTHKDKMTAVDAVHLRLIAVKDKAAAEEIRTALKKGEDFTRLAKDRSLVGADKGGDLGWVDPARLLPPVREVVPTLKVGETSGPLERGEQVLLVRLEERRPAHPMSLAEARPELERRLLAAQQQALVQGWLREQTKQSKIEVFLPPPGPITTGTLPSRTVKDQLPRTTD